MTTLDHPLHAHTDAGPGMTQRSLVTHLKDEHGLVGGFGLWDEAALRRTHDCLPHNNSGEMTREDKEREVAEKLRERTGVDSDHSGWVKRVTAHGVYPTALGAQFPVKLSGEEYTVTVRKRLP